MKNLPAAKIQSIIVVLSISAAYLLLHIPGVKMYSLQVFILSVLGFFLVKRFKRAKLWHVLPEKLSIEVGLLTFAFVFLIGATGNTHSVFYSLSYIHLFFLVFSSSPMTAVTGILGLLVFHYGLEPELGVEEIGTLMSIPVIGILILFAKKQYDEAHQNVAKLAEEEVKLEQANRKEQTLEGFIQNFLRPKLQILLRLLNDPEETKERVAQQVSLMETEMDKMVTRVSAVDTSEVPKKVE